MHLDSPLRRSAGLVAVALSCGIAVHPPSLAASSSLPPSTGKTFYVATNGSNQNSGTIARPWRTITHAVRVLKPGQRALVRRGRYAENVLITRGGTSTDIITVRNYPGERPVLVPKPLSQGYPLELYDTGYFRFRGFVVENAVGPSMTNVYVAGRTHHVVISHCHIRNSEQQGVFVERTTRNVRILSNRIYDNGRIGEPDQNHGIYLEGIHQLVANNVIFGQTNGFGIQVYPSADHVRVVDNTVVGNRLGGIVVGGDGSTAVDEALVANNIVVFNGGAGIRGYYGGGRAGSGNLAVRNLVWKNAGGNFVNDPAPNRVLSIFRSIIIPPGFVNLRQHDFRLASSSSALERGLARYSRDRDIRGVPRPQGPSYDIGAYERLR